MIIFLNGEAYTFAATPPTVAHLLARLGYTGKRIALECNGEIVPKSAYDTTILKTNDRCEVVVAVGGG